VFLGAHIGIADGLGRAPVVAREIGCDVIQIFSKSPQMWGGAPIPPETADEFVQAVRQVGLQGSAVHHGYLANLASPKPPRLRQSQIAFLDELRRAELLKVDYLILHPGAHMGSGSEAGVKTVSESLNGAFDETPGFHVRVLLENSAGQGTALGSHFEELAAIVHRVVDRSRVGVALDTCHLFASGLDFRTESAYGTIMDGLESALGTAEVRAFHLNDAKAEAGSHLDRHENIGQGKIGAEGFRHWLSDPRWEHHPAFLETPLTDDDYAAYRKDLKTLRSLLEPPAKSERPKPRARSKAPRRTSK